jgi:Tfp pilus assembly protein PilN
MALVAELAAALSPGRPTRKRQRMPRLILLLSIDAHLPRATFHTPLHQAADYEAQFSHTFSSRNARKPERKATGQAGFYVPLPSPSA